MKATAYSIGSDGSRLPFVRAVSAALARKTSDLKAQLLHDTLYFLLVHAPSLIGKLTRDSPIAIGGMLFAEFLYGIFYFFVRMFAAHAFLPVHVGGFRQMGVGEKIF